MLDRQRSLTVMSKGTPFTQQSYKVSDSFPFDWVKAKVRTCALTSSFVPRLPLSKPSLFWLLCPC